MRKYRSTYSYIGGVGLALLLTVSSFASVIADDITPPPPTPEETSIPLSIEETPTPPSPTETESEAIPSATPTPSLPEIQSQLPKNTSVQVVVDGELEPLVTQQAESAFILGDPIWCPVGASPIPGSGGCTASYLTLQALIDDIYLGNILEPASDGVIWILDGTDLSSSNIFFDGPSLNTWRDFELTLQGGWDGGSAGTIVGTSTFIRSISIYDWGASIFVNDISIINTNTTGLDIYTSADISLSNVFADNNNGNGIYLEGAEINLEDVESTNNDGNGIEIYSTGNVTLIGANIFSGNTSGSGLYVEAGGDFSAENLIANDNISDGAVIISAGNLTLTGTNIFNNNDGNGFYAETGLDAILENINTSGNGNNGVTLFSFGDVSLSGTNIFSNNINGYGLYIDSGGRINAENLLAESNAGNGIQLFAVDAVSIIGTNVFQINDGNGLYIDAAEIYLENVTSSTNNGNGAELFSASFVTLVGTNVFDGNFANGLFIDAGDDIEIENITATSNSINGVELSTANAASLFGTNVFTLNNNSGLVIFADSDIYAENVTANMNGTGGVYGSGTEFYTLGNFILTGGNEFLNNNDSGLYAVASGPIIIENITANDNGLGGYGIGAEIYTLAAFTLNGTNEFLSNNSSGIYVDAVGNITAENITANTNGAGGVYGVGAEFYTQGSFTLTGNNVFNNNYSEGLYIDAVNDISVNTANAFDNGGSGVFLSSTTGSANMVCGVLLGNAYYQIDANISNGNFLFLEGVNFGGTPNVNVNIDSDQLILISNDCFTYSEKVGGLIEGDGSLGIRYIYNADGLTITLDCKLYDGTYLRLLNGDAVFIPCPIVDTVRAITVPKSDLPKPLLGLTYFSAMELYITQNGKPLTSIEQENVVWYVNLDNSETAGFEAAYYDGTTWVDITYQITPFMTVLFYIPNDMRNKDFAILYWDGIDWVELAENTHLGNGRIVRNISKTVEGLYFQAEVNFIGTFVLVEK